MRSWLGLGCLATLLALISLVSCTESEDPTQPQPAVDTTAPLIDHVTPAADSRNVPVDADVIITFNETMSIELGPGDVSISHGEITDRGWPDHRTLVLTHRDWSAGTEITATVDTGLQDTAGNALAETVSWSFLTYTDQPLFFDSSPRDGDQNVPVDSQVFLVFSKPMEPATLTGAISVISPDKTIYGYTLSGELEDWCLTFDSDLPGSTDITVNINTTASDTLGNPLGSAASFGFTTVSEDDVIPPQIVAMNPGPGAIDVALNSQVTVGFDKDMSADSALGQVSISPGTITNLNWSDARTLVISQSGWPESSRIAVTVGSEIQDSEGTPMEHTISWSFFTFTEEVVLLGWYPSEDDPDVLVNTQVLLTFSKPMYGASLPGAITVTSLDKADHAFTLAGANENWSLTFDEDLPAGEVITVGIGVSAQDDDGQNLAEPVSFSFTTGVDADLTPPQLLRVDPPSGSAISAQTSLIWFTFDEPLDEISLDTVTLLSGQFWLAIANPESPVTWADNFSAFNIFLRTPLSPGSVFRLESDSFLDVHGNINEDGLVWEATVAGAADYMPVEDGWEYLFVGTWEGTLPGTASGTVQRFEKLETRWGGEFLRWIYENYEEQPVLPAEIPWAAYDLCKITASAVQYTGFFNDYSGQVELSTPIIQLPLPVVTGTWNGTSSFVDPQAGEVQIQYDGEVLAGVSDLPAPAMSDDSDPLPIHWLCCRQVVFNYEAYAGGELYLAGHDSLWYAPGIGIVGRVSEEQDSFGTRTSRHALGWAKTPSN